MVDLKERTDTKIKTGTIVAVAILVVAALGIGYTTLVPYLRGTPDDAQPASVPPATAIDYYRDFYNDHGATLPADLSVDRVKAWAEACVGGTMPPNTPDFLPTDELLRARAGWVCLIGPPVRVPETYCNAPGTGILTRPTVARGHLVAVRLGGHGNVRDDRGGCKNITPQERAEVNTKMRDGMESEAFTRASAGETIFYLSIPVYFEERVTPMSMYVFVIGQAGTSMGKYDNPPYLWQSGDLAR